jgi:hypothetical protein
MAPMPHDIDNPLILFRDILQHPDTGFIPIPAELIGIKQAAAQRRLSETAMRRRVKRLGIGFMIGKTIFIPVRGLDASRVGDTGRLDDVAHDMEMIRGLTNWPISPSTLPAHQIMPTMWNNVSIEEPKMQPSFSPTQRFPETLRMRLPEGMSAVLQFAARRRAQSTSDWVRQVLLNQLHQEGLVLLDTGAVRPPEEI